MASKDDSTYTWWEFLFMFAVLMALVLSSGRDDEPVLATSFQSAKHHMSPHEIELLGADSESAIVEPILHAVLRSRTSYLKPEVEFVLDSEMPPFCDVMEHVGVADTRLKATNIQTLSGRWEYKFGVLLSDSCSEYFKHLATRKALVRDNKKLGEYDRVIALLQATRRTLEVSG